jgi:hypothetical protein
MASTTARPQQQIMDDEDGVQTTAPDIGTLAVLNKSEIDQQIATARKFPRSIVNFRNEALQLCTLDERTAAECIYALPRKQFDRDSGQWQLKTIEGPSARFAEILNYAWGNTRAGARVVEEGQEFVTSQGLFYDLEKNTAISYEVKRRIVDSRNKRYSLDMIGTTANAASSIALRNAVLKGIPKALWSPMYMASRAVVAGDIRTLANKRDAAIKEFAIYGVTPEMIYATLLVRGIQDVTIDHLVVLRGILTAIQEGDTTPEQAFAPPPTKEQMHSEAMGSTTNGKASNLDEKYRQSNSEGPSAVVRHTTAAGETSAPPDPSAGKAVEAPAPSPEIIPEVQERRRELANQAETVKSRRGKTSEKPAPECASPTGIFDEDNEVRRGGE